MLLPRAPGTIQAILWDLDGTLLDTEALSDRAIFEALQIPAELRSSLGDRLPWEIKEPTLGKRGDEWVPMVIEYAARVWELCDPPSAEALWDRQEEILGSYCEEVRACLGATDLVERLAAHYQIPMGIATSSRTVSVDKKRLRHRAIFERMSAVVTGEMVARPKPAPDIYVEAAARLGVPPTRCLVFEDSVAGCQAGRAAGCAVIAVPDLRMADRSPFDGAADQILSDLTQFDPKLWGLVERDALG
jgi:beta-phosphoglucomutase-like phosphatase (HAD superfamily)